jgi:hypothetical protein
MQQAILKWEEMQEVHEEDVTRRVRSSGLHAVHLGKVSEVY